MFDLKRPFQKSNLECYCEVRLLMLSKGPEIFETISVFGIRMIDQMIFCFLFSIPSSFFNSLGKQLLRIFFKFSNKLTGANNVMEFMFSNNAGKHRQGPFSDNSMELLEKVNNRVLVTGCFFLMFTNFFINYMG